MPKMSIARRKPISLTDVADQAERDGEQQAQYGDAEQLQGRRLDQGRHEGREVLTRAA